jgi:hypothetical protein
VVLTTACQGDKDFGARFRLIWMKGCEVRIARQSSGPAPEVVVAGSVQSYAVTPNLSLATLTLGVSADL